MKTVLFDLDGTLLHVNMDKFLQQYLLAISNYCSELTQPEVFVKELLKATQLMIQNDGNLTNEEVFMQNFLPALGKEREQVVPLIESFYEKEFPLLERCIKRADNAPLVVEEVVKKGWQIILATNPLFPRQAIEERMRWAGINNFPWLHVTTYENSRSCKPNPLYYKEIITKYGLEPENCWMIGNDMGENLVASELGMKTYLVTDYLIERKDAMYVPQGRGTLAEFLDFVRKEM